MRRTATRIVKLKNGLAGLLNMPASRLSALSMLAVAALSILVYWRALGFAFFNDDPTGHLHWMEGLSLFQVFVTSEGYGFYRPIVFAAWKLLLGLFGGYNAPAFHALPIFLHAANTAFLWLLASHISSHRLYAWLAALAFATFPLSYEAVAYVAATFHPLLTFCTLLTLLLYRQARKSNASRYLVGAHITLLLGLFTHENSLVIPLFLLGWELLNRPLRSLRELTTRPICQLFAAPVVFGIIWLSVAKSGDQGLQPLPAIFANGLPFLQVLVYPLLPAFHITADHAIGLVVLALATLALTYLLARVAQVVRLWAFAFAWLILAAVPSMLFLEPIYLYGSPRLYYLASVGAALLWGLPFPALAQLETDSIARRCFALGLQVCAALAILLPPLPFTNCELDFFSQASHIVRSMSGHAATVQPDRELVYINLPFYFSSCPDHPDGCKNPYPFAPTGAVVIPPYASVRDFVRINGGPDRPVRGCTFSGYAPGWNTHGDDISLADLRALLRDAQVYVFDLTAGSFFNLTDAWHIDTSAPSNQLATFGHIIALDDATVHQTSDQVHVTLRWRALDAPQQALTAFVHLYDGSGALVAQHDGPPASNYAPTSFWQTGDVVDDTHVIILEAPPASGTYVLAVGLYDPLTGARLPAYSAQGVALPDSAYVVEYLTWP